MLGEGRFWGWGGDWKGWQRVLPRKMGDGSSVYGELIGRDKKIEDPERGRKRLLLFIILNQVKIRR